MDNYELVYQKLMGKVKKLHLKELVISLGGKVVSNELILTLLNNNYRIKRRGIFDHKGKLPPVWERILLCYYILNKGDEEIAFKWKGFNDFSETFPFRANFKVNVEEKIKDYFSQYPDLLIRKAKFLGGINWKKEGNSDYAFLFWGLPKIPILLLLWKAVEDFSAEAKILFDTSAIRYLDAESLAVLAMILADKLTEKKMN